MKKAIALFSLVVMLLASVSFLDSDNFLSVNAEAYSVGDIIEFGSYPQTRITSSSLISNLNSQSGTWKSYEYYIGGSKSDFMKYKDVTYKGVKYRAVTFSSYRPYFTDYSSSADNSFQDENGYKKGKTYWFRYDPLEWLVLDPLTGLVVCTSVIDSQDYHHKTALRTVDGVTVYANNWRYSSIRKWLNDVFYNTAFTKSQKTSISTTTIQNPAYSTYYSEYNADATSDKIYLLSYSDVQNTAYGFDSGTGSSNTRNIEGYSEYAACQGLSIDSSQECCYWRLRTAGYHDEYGYDCGTGVDEYLSVSEDWAIDRTNLGIRPAMCLNSLNDNIKSGETKTVTVSAGNTTYLKFVPTETAFYTFESNGSSDTYGYLYNSSGTEITSNDESGTDDNFKISYTLTAGTTYYFGCKYYLSSESGSYSVTLTKDHVHSYTSKVTKATLTKNGSIVKTCKICSEKVTTTIYRPKTFTLSKTSYTCTGKAIKPTVTVKDANGKTISSSNYTVSYSNNINPTYKGSTAKVKITFKGNYSGTKTLSFNIKLAQVKITSASMSSSYKVSMKWNKVADATKYEIYYYNNNYKAYKSNGKTAKTSYAQTWDGWKQVKLKVRAVYMNGSKVLAYGPWSSVATVKHK